jgi:hypothetical protein
LAVYPETTTFYPGVVYQAPKSNSNLYLIEFDDDEDEDGNLNGPRKISFKHLFEISKIKS